MLNLFGHNLLNGIVVDIGESNTTIIPVKNGFACYDKSVKSNFLSGRTITALMNKIDNEKNNSLKFLDYNKYDQNKRDNNIMKFWELNYPNKFIDYDDINQFQYSHLNFLFSYPELFRCLYRDDFSITNNEIKSSLAEGIKNYDGQRFINLEDIVKNKKKVDFSEFENELTSFYNQKNKNSLEKILNQYNGNYISVEELMKFRQFSLSHRIISKLEDYVNEDSNNGFKYSNIVFAGGVLNTPGLKNIIQKDIESLILNSKVTINFPLCDDCCCSMFKGANYISKLDNLESIMVSKQDYLEIGKENLCYNYI
jgi:actin-related protein